MDFITLSLEKVVTTYGAVFCCKGSPKFVVNGGAVRRSYTTYRHAFHCSDVRYVVREDFEAHV